MQDFAPLVTFTSVLAISSLVSVFFTKSLLRHRFYKQNRNDLLGTVIYLPFIWQGVNASVCF